MAITRIEKMKIDPGDRLIVYAAGNIRKELVELWREQITKWANGTPVLIVPGSQFDVKVIESRPFSLKIGRFKIDYDRNYGIDLRNGFTVVYDGIVCQQFRSNPISAIIFSIREIRNIRKINRP